jgi:mannose-6-phosphate isomerase
MRDLLEKLAHQFIKPVPDNLVEVIWGGDFIEKLKGLHPCGKRIGESWECSTHTEHPSRVSLGNGQEILLRDLVNSMSEETLGREFAQEFRGNLPVLIKFIDACLDLSVQVHPSDEKAQELREGDTGKDEAWLVLHAEEGSVLYLGFREEVDRAEFEKALSDSTINIAERYLNAIPARKGDMLFNPAGTIHAIGKGHSRNPAVFGNHLPRMGLE